MLNLVKRLKPIHLELIVEISKQQKLQLAADKLNMSQPAASRILSEIETSIGSPLFTRHPRWMEPTAVGEAFIKHARVILNEFDNLQSEIGSLKVGKTGAVRVGTVTGPGVGTLIPSIRQIKEVSPDIEATIEIGPSSQLVRQLKEGNLDFVIARIPADYNSSDFNVFPARDETVALLVWKDHPLANRANIQLDELLEFEWVVQEKGTPIREAVERGFLSAGCPAPQRVTNSSSLFVVLSLVYQSNTICPLASEVAELLTAEGYGTNLNILDIKEEILVSPYYVMTNKHQQITSSAEKLLDLVLQKL